MTCEGSLQVPLTHFTFSLVPDSSDGQVGMAQQIKNPNANQRSIN